MMSSSKSKLRSSSSFPNLLLSCLNFTLLTLSAASVGPTILLRTPPTSTGAAFLMTSAASLASALLGLCSQLTRSCFITHLCLALASLAGQILGILALFTKESSTLSSLDSPRDPREARLLARLECGALMAMLLLQAAVLALACALHSCWVREYEGVMEAEREAAAARRRRISRVAEESVLANNAAKIAEAKKAEANHGHVQWVKTDFEG